MKRVLFAIVAVSAGCGSESSSEDCVERVPSSIKANTTIGPGCFTMGRTTVEDGATLTIAPGTKIVVEAGGFLDIGPYNGAEALVAVGTADDPITFTSASASPVAGDWGCIHLGAGATASELAYVELAYGGAPCAYNGAGYGGALIIEAEIRGVRNSKFSNSATHGVRLHKPPRAFADNRFAANTLASIYARRPAVLSLGTGLVFENAFDVIRVAEFDLEATGDWLGQPVPFVLEGGFSVSSGANVRLMPGLDLRLDGGSFTVFDGTLEVAGEPSRPVVFTSARPVPAPGDWGCLLFDTPRGVPRIAGAVFEWGGSGRGCSGAEHETLVRVTDDATITGSTFRNSAGAGIQAITCDTAAWCMNTFASNATAPLECGFERTPTTCP